MTWITVISKRSSFFYELCESIYLIKHQTGRLDSSYNNKKEEVVLTSQENIFPPYAVKRSCNPKVPRLHLFRSLTGQHVALDSEHLAGSRRDEAVDLARELLHLAGVEHSLQPAGLGRELEQTLPLVLGEEGLLERGPSGVLLAALLLPVVDLLLLTAEHTLVVLVVVGLSVVGLDAVEQEVAVLLEEGVDAERQVVEVGGEVGGLGEGARLESAEGGREVGRPGGAGALQLVNEGGDQVRVVDLNGQLFEDILVAEVGL